jgi:hypothetical protein
MAEPPKSDPVADGIQAVDAPSNWGVAGDEEDAVPVGEPSTSSSSVEINEADPLNLGRHRRDNITQKQMKAEHPSGNKRLLKKYYTRQNELIDQFLGADDEERATFEEDARLAPKIKFAVSASFIVNFCLFVIQMYAAISTGSLSLFATAADAFVSTYSAPISFTVVDRTDSSQMDLVSSFVMLVTSKLAARPSVYKYPVVSPCCPTR